MKFYLIDTIASLTDEQIIAVKHVSTAEEYLADHFPGFPVLPGVLMVEALVQAAGWLLHRRRAFGGSIAVLKEARNVRYGQFVPPGEALRLDVTWKKDTDTGAAFTAAATLGERQSLSARIELAYFNLGDRDPNMADVDRKLIEHHKARWAVLQQIAGPTRNLEPDG